MHITFLAISPTWWIVGTLVFFASTLAVSLILYRNAHVGQRTIAALTGEVKVLKATASHATGMYNSLRQQFNEADDEHAQTIKELRKERDDARAQRDRINTERAHLAEENAGIVGANEKLRGQLMEKHSQLIASQTTNEAYTEAIDEQHEQIAEQKRTITQQQQIIDDLRKSPLQLPVSNTTNPQKPAPRTLPPDDWRNIPNTDSPAQEPTKPAPRKKGAQ